MTSEIEKWETIRLKMEDCMQYPKIPPLLLKVFDTCFKKGKINRAMAAILSRPENTLEAINKMFAIAAQATGLESEALLKSTGLNHKDTSPERLESAFAEIRAINFLSEEKFDQIKPLTGSAEAKRADICALKDNEKYSIEVVNSIYTAQNRTTPDELFKWLISRIRGEQKNNQVQRTANEEGAKKKVYIAIVDSYEATIYLTHTDFMSASKEAWEQLGSDPDTHVCFVTGRVEMTEGRDDSVFPPW